MSDRVQVFDSGGTAYKAAFEVFLENTDQKRRAREWFQALLTECGKQQVLIDAGAGSGEVTAWLAPWFEKTIAVEPNPHLLTKLRALLPAAETICQPILHATPPAKADLVVCSHTFYYLPQQTWLQNVERLLSWMRPSGRTVIVVQHHDTDCMRMLERFCGHRFNLGIVADMLHAHQPNRYTTAIIRNDAHIETKDFESTFAIAEFMLNLLPLSAPPTKPALAQYIRENFTPAGDGYRFSCHQDFLTIQERH